MSAKSKQTIAVAMSGGVDSSVTAALLLEAGYQVFGIYFRTWRSSMHTGPSVAISDSEEMAQLVANQLDMQLHILDTAEPFRMHVVEYFQDTYTAGKTPNPCIICNREFKFGHIFKEARRLGADKMATGHYARLTCDNGWLSLQKAIDSHKDQSYFLSMVNHDVFKDILFPLGSWTKAAVRSKARELDIPVSTRKDSQDLCFVDHEDYREYLKLILDDVPLSGPITDSSGKTLGKHTGLYNYTIGQRKHLGLAAGYPLYVLSKDIDNNKLVVGPLEELGYSHFLVESFNWLIPDPLAYQDISVRVRYQSEEIEVKNFDWEANLLRIELISHFPDITPGQAAVLYKGDTCLGGGLIKA